MLFCFVFLKERTESLVYFLIRPCRLQEELRGWRKLTRGLSSSRQTPGKESTLPSSPLHPVVRLYLSLSGYYSHGYDYQKEMNHSLHLFGPDWTKFCFSHPRALLSTPSALNSWVRAVVNINSSRWMAILQKHGKNSNPDLVCLKEIPPDKIGATGCQKKWSDQNTTWPR